MKKTLTRIFSVILAAATALSVSAAPLTAKKVVAKGTEKVALTTPAKAAPAKTAGKGKLNLLKQTTRKGGVANPGVFRSASKTAKVPVKSPYKAAPAYAAAGLPQIYGSVIYSTNPIIEAPGYYTIPTSASEGFTVQFLGADASNGGVLVDDIYYTCVYEDYGFFAFTNFYGYDINTGECIYDHMYSYQCMSMTLDRTTGVVYGAAIVEDVYCLVKITFDESEVVYEPIGEVELAGETLGMWNSIACDGNGQLWGIWSNAEIIGEGDDAYVNWLGATLYKIDKNTAVTTKVGDTGITPYYLSDGTFDTKTNRLFWTVSDQDGYGYLAEVNTATGVATKIYDFPGDEEVVGLVIPVVANEDAPAAPTNLEAAFNGSSLTGTINFKAPTTTAGGSNATGALTYSVKANNEEVATGSTTYGANVAAEVTVAAAGMYNFVVTVKNDAGESPKAQVKAYVGADTPEATTVKVEYVDGVMNVSWLPVTGSVNGGYINPAAVTYNVQRMPGHVLVAEGLTETSFSEAIPEPDEITTYYYNVVAEFEGLFSEVAQSNLIVLGSVVPPFTATFDDDTLEGFSVIDANGDAKMWTANSGRARMGYNSNLAMDDWLITPPLKLEAGKLYDIAADIAAQSTSYPERIEVKIGKAADPSAMTTVLLEPTVITELTSAPLEWSTTFVPETDGNYFVGFHGISDADTYYLWVDNVSVSAPKSTAGPAAVTDLTVTPGANGAKTATITFTTPDKAIDGSAITSLTKVELSRNGEVIKTWDAPAVGAVLTYTDTVDADNDYTYTVVAYNAEGNGAEAVASAFIGVDYPAPVQNVVAFETANPGEITVTWDAVTTDEAGNPLDASMVTYQVYGFEGNTRVAVSAPLSATTYTFQAVPAGQQDFVEYAVFAMTSRGEGEGAISDFFPAGTPYNGLTLSSSNDLNTYILGTSSAGGGSWGLYTDEFGVPSQDGDNSLFGMQAQYLNQYGSLFTGLVSLEGIVNPGFTFYTYNIALNGGDDINEIAVGVKEKGAAEFTTVKTVVVNEVAAKDEWGRVAVDLSAYAGKVIQIELTAVVKAAAYTFVDNMKVGSMLANDLAAAAISAPAKVKAGEDYAVTVTVANEGVLEATGYTVELYSGSELVEAKAGEALAAGDKANVEFNLAMSALATEPVTYFAKVVYAADENETNNQTDNVTVTPVVSNYPVVNDLAGAAQDGAVKLTWSEPNLDAAPAEAVTEDFEDADAFSATYGDWIFVDLDQSEVGGFQGTDVPGITPGTTTGSFWIWDQAQLGNESFGAHSGTKYLFALFRYDDGTTNDWAISPELSGDAQTVSFYAKSYSATYPEKIEVYYSTGSTEPADFVKVNGVGGTVPGDWTLYEAEVPAGATRFAIRSCATGSFMLMVDDVTFIPAGSTANLDIVGYNVYRDGVKITEAPVAECEFVDTNVEAGVTYSYVVTVVYTKGESAASNAVVVTGFTSGLDAALAASVNVSVEKSNIVITGAAGQTVAVYAADGKTLFAGKGEAKTVVPATRGVYVVKAGTTVKKVLVK